MGLDQQLLIVLDIHVPSSSVEITPLDNDTGRIAEKRHESKREDREGSATLCDRRLLL
jgi:hypothetical protein